MDDRDRRAVERHLHVTDIGPSGMFEVNTFRRALERVGRPMQTMPEVVHFRRGKPSVGIAIGERLDAAGRRNVDVISPALGPDGPYLDLVSVRIDACYPSPTRRWEATAFLLALVQYSQRPTDATFDAANDALAAWGEGLERAALPRAELVGRSAARRSVPG